MFWWSCRLSPEDHQCSVETTAWGWRRCYHWHTGSRSWYHWGSPSPSPLVSWSAPAPPEPGDQTPGLADTPLVTQPRPTLFSDWFLLSLALSQHWSMFIIVEVLSTAGPGINWLTDWLTHWHCRPHSTSSPHCAEVCCGMSSISTIQSRIYEWWCCRRKLQQESCDSCIITENLLLSPNALCTEPHCFCVSESRSLDPLPCSNKLTFCRELRDLRHQWRQTVDTKLEIPPSVMTSQKQFYFEIMKLVLMENIWYENTQFTLIRSHIWWIST